MMMIEKIIKMVKRSTGVNKNLNFVRFRGRFLEDLFSAFFLILSNGD